MSTNAGASGLGDILPKGAADGKGTTAAPQMTGENAEMVVLDKKPLLPIEEDIMQLSRLGEVDAVKKLFDSGKFDISYKDEEGITPLHVRHILLRFARSI
jgi:palmitoyltransferase ZDHHC13/17